MWLTDGREEEGLSRPRYLHSGHLRHLRCRRHGLCTTMASFKTADSGRTCRRRGIESTATDLPQYRSRSKRDLFRGLTGDEQSADNGFSAFVRNVEEAISYGHLVPSKQTEVVIKFVGAVTSSCYVVLRPGWVG